MAATNSRKSQLSLMETSESSPSQMVQKFVAFETKRVVDLTQDENDNEDVSDEIFECPREDQMPASPNISTRVVPEATSNKIASPATFSKMMSSYPPNTITANTPTTMATASDMAKYNKVLTPDVLDTIMSLQGAGGKLSEPHLVKLEDGTLIKVNFGTMKKALPPKKKRIRKKPPKEPKKVEPKPKKRPVRSHPLKGGKICPADTPCGERLATYRNKKELEALIFKCPICTCFHCPLCLQEKYRPTLTKRKCLEHIDHAHWNQFVKLVIDDEEYTTISCKLHHGVYRARHLHCPCGQIYQKHQIRVRFLQHRKTQCVLTKHFHPKPTVKKKMQKREPKCLVNAVPEDHHRSVCDSIEELLDYLVVCKNCKKYHCILCLPSAFHPATLKNTIKHVKTHFKLHVSLKPDEGPYFVGCKLKHGELKKRHYHCLCGQIIKSEMKQMRKHIAKCQYVLLSSGNRDNYKNMNIYPKNSTNDIGQFITPIQIRLMIPRNSMPLYGSIGEKIPPPALDMSVFDNLRELCSIIKRCYTCCTRFHCPLCTTDDYSPSSRLQLAKHLINLHNRFKLRLPSGQFTYPCFLPHGKATFRHYHCVCGHTPIAKSRFLKHTKMCEHAGTRILNPTIEQIRHYLMNESREDDISQFNHTTAFPDVRFDTVEEIYGGSSSEDEDGDDTTMKEGPCVKEEPVESPSCGSVLHDHMYLEKEGHWEENLQDHIKARERLAEEMAVLYDENHHEGHDFEPNSNAVVSETELNPRNVAIKHSITNTTQSHPVMGIFNPFDLLVAQVQQCRSCCSLYHCPYCPPSQFMPTTQKNTFKHLRTHWSSRVTMIDGTYAVPCFLEHNLSLLQHYHCMCGDLVDSAKAFYGHIQKCPYMVALADDCKNGIQDVNLPMPSRTTLVKTVSNLDEVVSQLENLINPPVKGTEKAGRPKRKRNSRKNAPIEYLKPDESRSLSYESRVTDKNTLLIADTSKVSRKRKHQEAEEPVIVEKVNPNYEESNETVMQMVEEIPDKLIITSGTSMEGSHKFQHDGITYDIVIPPDGIVDVSSLQSLLAGNHYLVVTND